MGRKPCLVVWSAMIQVSDYVKTFEAFPPRQASFSPEVDDIIELIGKQPVKE